LASKHKFLKAGFLAYILNISQVDANTGYWQFHSGFDKSEF